MNLKDLSKSVVGILGKPEKPVNKAQTEAIRRDIESLQREMNKVELWSSLAVTDKAELFPLIINGKIDQIKEQYIGIDPAGLARLQVQHCLLKEMLFSYQNAVVVRAKLNEQLDIKKAMLERGAR